MSLQRSNSYRRACVGIVCALGALLASCATGVGIDGEVLLVPYPEEEEVEGGDDLDGATNSLEPAIDDADVVAGAEPSTNAESEDSNASPAEEPDDDDPEQVPAEGIPIDTEQDNDDIDRDNDNDPDPIIPPDPSPSVPPVDVQPPSSTPPSTTPPSTTPPITPPIDTTPPAPSLPPTDPLPPVEPPALPLEGHCLSAWEGSSCDTCSGQTQSDLLACRVYIDCYIINECDPLTCGSIEQACGVNSLGNGLAPKGVADAVYSCMCTP